MMSFPDAVSSCLRKYVVFSGRATRAEYWWFYLATLLASMVASVIDAVAGLGVFSAVVSLGVLLPSLAVSVRRLHDSNLSGWWLLGLILAALVALVMLMAGFGVWVVSDSGAGGLGVMLAGGLTLLAVIVANLWLMLRSSTPGPNRFGPHPTQPTQPPYPGVTPGWGTYPPHPPAL